MAAPTSTNEVTARKLSSSISALWTKIKSTFQPVADRVTSIRAASSATDTNYPSEKAVRTELDAKAADSAVLHKAGLETASGQKWFEGGFCVFNNGHVGYGHFTLAGTSRGSAYNDWTEEQKDGAHFREWSLSFNTGVNFWGKLRITIATSFSSFNASGSMQKTINCAFNTKEVFNNTGYYNDLGINTEKEFRISDLIWNNTTECWEIKIHSIKPTSNNSVPVLLIEFWTYSTTNRESALGIHWVSTSPSIVTDTTYYTKRSGDASTSPGTGGEQFNWADTPVQQSPYGYEIFNRSHTIPVGNGGTGRTSVTSGNYVVGAGTSAMVEKTPKEVGSNVLSSLDDKSNASSYANFVDGDFVVGSDHVDASTISASTFVRRTALNLWNYIKGKISSVLGLTASSYGGNAATATNATTADTAKAYDTSFSGTDSIASKFGTKADDISYSDGSPDASLNLGARLLAGVLLPTSSLRSMRLSVVLAIDLNISGSDVKGGILRADVAMNSGGSYFAKKCWLTGVTGSLSVSDFKVAYGTGLGNKKAVGIIWDGAIDADRKMHARVIDYYAEGGDFVFNADVANVTASSFSGSHVSAADDNVVHTTGDESVGGKKTFTDPVVESVSTSGDYSGFFVQRGSSANTRYRISLEVNDSAGERGIFDYGGSSYAGENNWIIKKKDDGTIDVGSNGNRNKVRLGGVTLDFSGTVGNVADTFYIAN